ncbi:MAG TPA: hypothetical protein VHU91_06860, partial [Mycobacteriales bacterium]|nr:hypothetical protein [Mycobacteriales bacterium]
DGNVGIGGDPDGLLRRCMQLVAPGGRIIVEVDPADVDRAYEAYLVDSDGRSGDPFPWAQLGFPALRRRVEALGFSCVHRWGVGGRSFGEVGRLSHA